MKFEDDIIEHICIESGIYTYLLSNQVKDAFNKLELFLGDKSNYKIGVKLMPIHMMFLKRYGYEEYAKDRFIIVKSFKELIVGVLKKEEYIDYIVVYDTGNKIKDFFRKIVYSYFYGGKVFFISKLLEKAEIDPKLIGFSTFYEVVNYDKNNLEQCDNYKKREIYLKRLIADMLLIRDFVNAKKYSEIVVNCGYDQDGSITTLINSIEKIYEELGNKIETLNKKHIVLNWVDCVTYSDFHHFKNLVDESKNGIFYTNMYTSSPYTAGTMKVILSGKKLIDDYAWKETKNINNDYLLKLISENNYEFEYIGLQRFKRDFFKYDISEYDNRKMNYFTHVPSTVYQYELLVSMANAVHPKLYIVHNLYETHSPFMNPIQCEYGIIDDFAILECRDNEVVENMCENQIKYSYEYFDEQLNFYRSNYKDKLRYEIIFSDHGRFKPFGHYGIETKTHIFMMILGDNVKSKVIETIHSNIEFTKIVKNLFDNKISEIDSEYGKDYVQIQFDDCYSDKVFNLLQNELVKNMEYAKWNYFQYRCIRTLEDAYIRFAYGDEYYEKKGMEGNQIKNKEYKDRIDFLKELDGCKFINTFNEEKYISGKKMYELFNIQFPDDNVYV